MALLKDHLTDALQPTAVSDPPPIPQATVFSLTHAATDRILAMGAERKAALCVAVGKQAWLGRPIGDLQTGDAYRAYLREVTAQFVDEHAAPVFIAHDLHPHYLSTVVAKSLNRPTLAVQHHHAHVAAVTAEWAETEPVIGLCCDGVGYGPDGAAWGGEVLWCDAGHYRRLGHLDYFPLPGGDAAAIDTWRPALSLLKLAFANEWHDPADGLMAAMPPRQRDECRRFIDANLAAVRTSSLGRVFDAVAFLLGLCNRNDVEAQAAVAVESAAAEYAEEAWPYETRVDNGSIHLSLLPAIRALTRERLRGDDPGRLAARFHETVARLLTTAATLAAEQTNTPRVALAGGCFANRRLRERCIELLERRRLSVLAPRRVTCGDGAIALGQAAIAARILERSAPCASPFRVV